MIDTRFGDRDLFVIAPDQRGEMSASAEIKMELGSPDLEPAPGEIPPPAAVSSTALTPSEPVASSSLAVTPDETSGEKTIQV